MRATLLLSILLMSLVMSLFLGLSSAAPEPDYSRDLGDYLHTAGGNSPPQPVEFESFAGRTDRLTVASLQPHIVSVEILTPGNAGDTANTGAAATATAGTPDRGSDVSLNDLCNALFTSALDNDLPIPFFANLIWQESRLRDDAVSSKGALGIAQFMPQTAVETGLDNPFDPLQAIPASAHFLRELRLEFGNLGFVAAAYNAGAHRVAEWLEHRGSLPRETRGYVVRVTGLSVDDWRHMAVDDDALAFVRHLPCRTMPAFAIVAEMQSEQVQLQQAKLERIKLEEAKLDKPAGKARPAPHGGLRHAAERRHGRGPHERRQARRVVHRRSAGKHEATRHARDGREKHKRA